MEDGWSVDELKSSMEGCVRASEPLVDGGRPSVCRGDNAGAYQGVAHVTLNRPVAAGDLAG